MDLEKLCNNVKNIALEAGQFIREEKERFSTKHIQSKGKHNFFSYVDKGAEDRIVSSLNQLDTDIGIIAEEGDYEQNKQEYCWVIDPLDGTTNFIHGLPPHSVSIGLVRDKEPVLGVIYEVVNNELFWAYKNGGAWFNNSRIKVSETETLNDSLLATGFPYTNFNRLDEYLRMFTFFMKNSHGLRRLGSAAVDLAYVACGRFEGFFEYGLQPWDVAGGAAILLEAGGKLTDYSGENNYIFGEELVASNGAIHNEFLKAIQERI